MVQTEDFWCFFHEKNNFFNVQDITYFVTNDKLLNSTCHLHSDWSLFLFIF